MSSLLPFTVHPFTEENLFKIISNKYLSLSEVKNHQRASYLCKYLFDLNARSLVVEESYVDADYLDDFIAVYANCFSSYERFCKRIHFFNVKVVEEELIDLIYASINAERKKELLGSYLGFTVIRPLPKAIIGRTVIKTYDSHRVGGSERYYTVTREYTPNFFGVELSVESLAFQEQDKGVAACATVALWSCFHKTAKLFGTRLPSPASITRVANQVASDSRIMPSQGLTIEQICNAIYHVGLEPEVIILKEDPIIPIAYGYLHMGLPVIAIAELIDEHLHNHKLHAITLTGFALGSYGFILEEAVPTKGHYIDVIYGHDDQLGPFSKMVVRPICSLTEGSIDSNTTTSFLLENTTGTSYKITHFIIPVYKKIRLSFIDNLKWINRLHMFIIYMSKILNQQRHEDKTCNLLWDIHLIQINDYKKKLRKSLGNGDSCLIDYTSLILEPHPRFIWRSVLEDGTNKIIEILADATEMPGSFPIYRIIWHDQDFREKMLFFMKWISDKQKSGDSNSRVDNLYNALTKRFVDIITQ